ncbi:Ltp family lipoprotein, partial [Enterococcus faecium]
NALQAAKDYLDYSAFSKDGLYDQLVYEKYTPEQAQYAIDNLPN